MGWEDVIKNVRDTPMGDMEQYERDALSSEKEDGRSRAPRDELRDRLDNVVQECEDGINRIINNSRMVDAKYAEKLLEGIRKTALGR